MKALTLLTAIVALVTITSCSKYQYVYLNSTLPKNENHEFFQENDTLVIKYIFASHNCPVTIQVYNKLEVPLYVDWKKSAVILNDRSVNLWEDKSVINGTNSQLNVKWDHTYSTSYGDFSGTIYRNERISIISPRSYVEVSPLYLLTKFLPLSTDSVTRAMYSTPNGLKKLKRYNYNRYNTPFQFRSFLAYSTKEDFITENYLQNDFWVSDIVPTGLKLPVKQANNFYLQQSSGVGTVAAVAILAGVLVIGASIPQNADQP